MSYRGTGHMVKLEKLTCRVCKKGVNTNTVTVNSMQFMDTQKM